MRNSGPKNVVMSVYFRQLTRSVKAYSVWLVNDVTVIPECV